MKKGRKKTVCGLLASSVLAVFASGFSAAAADTGGPADPSADAMSPAAQAEVSSPIRVYVEGELLAFGQDPLLIDGTTLVPFRPILQKLGFQVDYDGNTRTVTGKKAGLTIEFVPGVKAVRVNGAERPLEQAPRIVDPGVTMVPLRMIGETAGYWVNWNGYERRIDIGSRERLLKGILETFLTYQNREDKAGTLSMIDPSQPSNATAGQLLSFQFAMYDLEQRLESFELLEAKDAEATVRATVTAKLVRGARESYRDNRIVYLYQIINKSGSWKIGNTIIARYDYLDAATYIDEKPNVPDADRKVIEDFVGKLASLVEKEDVESFRAILHPEYPRGEQEVQQFQALAAAYDLTSSVSDVRIIRYSGTEAAVRYVSETKSKAGQPFRDNRSEQVTLLKKDSKGEWKYMGSIPLYVEFLDVAKLLGS